MKRNSYSRKAIMSIWKNLGVPRLLQLIYPFVNVDVFAFNYSLR